MLPPFWGAELFQQRAWQAGWQGARSWERQSLLLYEEGFPAPWLSLSPDHLPRLSAEEALYDLLRESTPSHLEAYARRENPTARSRWALFYAARYAFLRRAYSKVLYFLERFLPQELPPSLREEMQYMRGYAAYVSGEKEQAISYFRPLSEKIGHFHDAANYYLGVIHAERGDWRGAVGYFSAVQVRPPYLQEAPLWLAYALIQTGDFVALRQWSEKWNQQKPEPAHADTLWALVVSALAKVGMCEEAQRYAGRVPHHPFAQFWTGLCAYRQGNDSLALRRWEPLFASDDTLSAWAKYVSAHAFLRSGRREEALGILRGIPKSSGVAPLALWLQAQIAWQLRLPESGIEALQAYLLVGEVARRREALRWLAEMLAMREEYTTAIAMLDTIPQPVLQEAVARFRILAGLKAFAEKDYERAESLFAEAQSRPNPYQELARFWQAETRYRAGDAKRAIPLYHTLLQAQDKELAAEARLALSWAYLRLGLVDETLRAAEPLKTHKKLGYYATFLIANALYLQKRYREALPLYRELLSSDLPGAQVRYHLAQTLIRLEQYAEADDVLASVSISSPGADAALYLRAELCGVWLARPACTKEAASLLLRHFPNSPRAALARARLGLALVELGQKEEAQTHLREVLDKHIHQPEAVRLALEGLKHSLPPTEYDEVYRSLLSKLPPQSETRLSFERERLKYLRESARWSNLLSEAEALAQKYPALAGEALLYQALAAENLADTNRAMTLYQRLAGYPDYAPQAWEKLARLHQQQGRLEQAFAAQDSLLQHLPTLGYARLQGILTWCELAQALGRRDTTLRLLSQLLRDTLLGNLARQRVLLTAARFWESDQPDTALGLLHQVEKVEKNFLAAEAVYHQARLLYKLGRKGEARAAIYRLRDEMPQYLEPRAQAYLVLARIFIEENKRRSARQLLESLIANAPTEPIRAEARQLMDSIPPDPPAPPSTPAKPKKKKKPSGSPPPSP
ncbi:MAG: tetratricopeptide repeat protein [Bacteroidia bacterium]|nr:tetratricopeptide repeat protein [Bacteroidia bacterium]